MIRELLATGVGIVAVASITTTIYDSRDSQTAVAPKQELGLCVWYRDRSVEECRLDQNPVSRDSCLSAVLKGYDACIERKGK